MPKLWTSFDRTVLIKLHEIDYMRHTFKSNYGMSLHVWHAIACEQRVIHINLTIFCLFITELETY